jgi:methionyl-tRNA formyltransferase
MTAARLRVAFAGTPAFAAVALQALHEGGHEIVRVFTQPDRPAGRGLKLTPSPVKALAGTLGVPVAQPAGLRLDGRHAEDARAARDLLQADAPDVLVVAAYGLLLPAWVLGLPRLGCLNIHASLLPRWRGAAPIHRAIEAGDAETGITIMQMDAGLDTGAMLLVGREPIGPDDTTGRLHDRLAVLGGRLVVQALAAAAAGRLQPVEQPGEGVTYAHKIAKSEAALDWSHHAAVLERRVRAFDPLPGAAFEADGETLKLWRASVVPEAGAGAPGSVVDVTASALVIACGEGALALHEIQRPGGRRQPVAAWLKGRPWRAGERLK